MGAIVDVACKSCGSGWQCMIGCGLMHGSLQVVAGLFPENIRKEIMEQAGQEKFPLFDFSYQLSCCPQCNSIESVPVIRMRESYKAYIGNCPACGQDVRLVRNLSKAECPICQKKTLEEQETGHWD